MTGPSGRHHAPAVGARVVLRYRREPGSVPSQSDALGVLEALTPRVRVRTADGSAVTVDPDRVVVLKSVPPKPVRTSAIRTLEAVLARARPGTAHEWVAGWVATAGGAPADTVVDALGVHGATPLADPSMPEGDFFHDLLGAPTLDALHAWYSRRGLPLTLRLPDRLVRPPSAWGTFGEHTVLTATLARAAAGDGAASPPTLAADGRSARVRTAVAAGGRAAPVQMVARLTDAQDATVWAVLVVETPGVGDAAEPAAAEEPGMPDAVRALCAWAAEAGAAHAALAVPADAPDATAFDEPTVRALGFADHHRCRFVRLRSVSP